MKISQSKINRIFSLVQAGHKFTDACRSVDVRSRTLMVWIYASRDGQYADDGALWTQYESTCVPRCDLCSLPVPIPKQRIREGANLPIEMQLMFCSVSCQQQWHEEENDE